MLSIIEWVKEWQKELPSNYWLHIEKKNGFYEKLWLNISADGQEIESNLIHLIRQRGKIAGFKTLETGKKYLPILGESYHRVIERYPIFSATPSNKIEAVNYYEDPAIQEVYREILFTFDSEYKAKDYCRMQHGNCIEFPDGKVLYCNQYGQLIEPDHETPFA